MSKLSEKEPERVLGAFKRDTGTCATIPYFAHEAEVMRMERHHRRLCVALIVSVMCILLSNLFWLWYISHYHFPDDGCEQDETEVDIIYEADEGQDDDEDRRRK